jgi:hypothetical protein
LALLVNEATLLPLLTPRQDVSVDRSRAGVSAAA